MSEADSAIGEQIDQLHASMSDEEMAERVKLLAQPGVWVMRVENTCQKCGRGIAIGQLARSVDRDRWIHVGVSDCT